MAVKSQAELHNTAGIYPGSRILHLLCAQTLICIFCCCRRWRQRSKLHCKLPPLSTSSHYPKVAAGSWAWQAPTRGSMPPWQYSLQPHGSKQLATAVELLVLAQPNVQNQYSGCSFLMCMLQVSRIVSGLAVHRCVMRTGRTFRFQLLDLYGNVAQCCAHMLNAAAMAGLL